MEARTCLLPQANDLTSIHQRCGAVQSTTYPKSPSQIGHFLKLHSHTHKPKSNLTIAIQPATKNGSKLPGTNFQRNVLWLCNLQNQGRGTLHS